MDSPAATGIPSGAADFPNNAATELPPTPSPGKTYAAAAATDADTDAAPPSSPIPIRAPVSEEVDDGGGSTGSGESFDSALERMAGSSTGSFDTAVSPRAAAAAEDSFQNTARVMPKALVSPEDNKRVSSSGTSSSSSSSSSSGNGDDDEDGENGVDESTGENGEDMPVAKVYAEDLEAGEGGEEENDEDGDGGEEGPAEKQPQSAQGLRVSTDDLDKGFGEGGGDEAAEVEQRETDAPPAPEPEPESAQGMRVLGADEDGERALPVLGAEEVDDVKQEEPVAEQIQAAPPAEQDELIEEAREEPHAENPEVVAVAEEAAGGGGAAEEVINKPDKEPDNGPAADHIENGKNSHEATVREVDLVGSVAEVLKSQSGREAAVPETESEDDDDEDTDEADASAALRAFAQAAAAAETPSLGSAGPSLPAKPTAPRLLSAHEGSRSGGQAAPPPNPSSGAPAANAVEPSAEGNPEANDENMETREKLQMIRVKFLRLAQRLGQSANNVVVAQVLYRLGLAEQLRGGRGSSRNSAFSFERASAIAEEQEAAGQEELDFTCTIMVLGKSGVGKSATINSLFDEVKTETNAFTYSTKKVQEITGTVHGIKLRVIDTPGLLPAVADQRHNEKVMASVKRFIKKSPPDIVLYFDRLDMQSRDYGDLPLLRTITDTFGAAIWFNAIVVLTHASSAPPDGPNGLPLSYEMFVAQRSHVVQQTIRQAAGDMRLMNPVSLVENHSACRTNRAGERVLPNGQVWKPQLLLLCFASKILAEANSLLKLQESTPGKPFMRSKVPPLPFLLSSLLQSRPPLKHTDESGAGDDDTDDDLEDVEDSDEEDYDELPPFRRLTKEELDQLDKSSRKEYFEELHLREKLFQKKQWKEELRRRREMKKRAASSDSAEDYQAPMDDGYDDDSKSAPVPVPLPDMQLPPTFESDNPVHRYRYLETASQWLVRPVMDLHGWDRDNGYDGFNMERMFSYGKIPASITGQVTKDKKEANVTLECAASVKHSEGKVSQAGFDVQTVGKDYSYTLRTETRFNNVKKNKTIAGCALTMIGETMAYGLKIEDRLMIGRRVKVVMNGGALTGKGDTAYGGTVEISLRDKDFPLGRSLSTCGLSVMNWHGDMALGGNLQSQFMVGKTMVVARGNLNNRGAGQITIRLSSAEQLQIALIGVVPILKALFNAKFGTAQQA